MNGKFNILQIQDLENELAGGIREWSPNTEYKAGDLIKRETTILRALTNHTSGGMFDAANWSTVGEGTSFVNIVTGEPAGIGSGIITRVGSDGMLYVSSRNSMSEAAGTIGFNVAATGSGQLSTVALDGAVEFDDTPWELTGSGVPLYLGESGMPVTDLPKNLGEVILPVGVGIGSRKVAINILDPELFTTAHSDAVFSVTTSDATPKELKIDNEGFLKLDDGDVKVLRVTTSAIDTSSEETYAEVKQFVARRSGSTVSIVSTVVEEAILANDLNGIEVKIDTSNSDRIAIMANGRTNTTINWKARVEEMAGI